MQDVRQCAVPQDITFPLVKEELVDLADGSCVPQALTFPTIKDEVIDDDDEPEYVWWDLKPDKEQLDFAVIKDEYIDYDYQAREHTNLDQVIGRQPEAQSVGAQPVSGAAGSEFESQDISVSNGSEEEDQRWSDDLLATHGRHTNRFTIDSDPEELDESLYSHITFNPKNGEAGASIWDCTMYEECGNGIKQEEVIIDGVKTHSDAEIKLEANSEDVIVLDDDDDDIMVKAYGSDTTSVNDGVDNNDIIVIDDDDDDNFVNNKCQQENYEIENEQNSDDSPVKDQKTTEKKRKRKQNKNKIKCIVLFDGQETRRIPVISKHKRKKSDKKHQINVSHTRHTETAEDEIQETDLNNSMYIDDRAHPEVSKDGGDMLSLNNNSEIASFGRAEHANKLLSSAGDCGEYSVNTAQRHVYSTESTHQIKSSMQIQQQCSKSVQGLKEFDKSEQDVKQYTCAQKIRNHKSIQDTKLYKSKLEMKRSGTSTQERMQHSASAHTKMQLGASAQDGMKCGMSEQERMQHGVTAQERMQHGMTAQERMRPSTYVQERMQLGASAQEIMQCGISTQDVILHSASAQKRMQHGVSSQEKMHHDALAQERLHNDPSAHERMQHDKITQERLQCDMSVQEMRQHDASTHERMQHGTSVHERMQHDMSAQERMQHGMSAQERIKHGMSDQERMRCGMIAQEMMRHGMTVQERMRCGMTTHDRMRNGTTTQERMQNGTNTQERMQRGTSAQKMQYGMSAQDKMQLGMSAQERLQPVMSAQERLQPGMFGQERLRLSMSAQERLQPGMCEQERLRLNMTAQERMQAGTATQERMQPGMSAKESLHSSQSTMGNKPCSTSLQDVKYPSKPVEKLKQCRKLSEVVEQCKNSTHIKENRLQSSLKKLQNQNERNGSCDPQKSEIYNKLRKFLMQKIVELGLVQIQTQSVKLTEGSQTANTSQEITESPEGLLLCNRSIKVLQKRIASLQRSSKCAELENDVQQCRTTVGLQKGESTSKELLQYCVGLLEELVRSHHTTKEVQSNNMSLTESQQIQSAASNAQPHDQSGIDFMGCEKSINLQHLNNNMNPQFIDLSNGSSEKSESAENSHRIETSISDKQQIDHAENNLENGKNLFYSSRPSETVSNETLNQIPVACKLCSKQFKSYRGLKIHIKKMHSELMYRYCLECQQDCLTFESLRHHYKSQHSGKSFRQRNRMNRSIAIKKHLENQAYSLISEQKLVLNKGHQVCNQQSVHIQYHNTPIILLNEEQKNRQQQLGDTVDQHNVHSTNPHVISRPASFQSNTTAPHSQPATLQSSVTFTNSMTAPSQSSPLTSASKPVPLPPCPASLKLRYAPLQTSPSREHPNQKNTPFDSISTPQTNHSPLPDGATYMQKIVKAKIRNMRLPMLASNLETPLQTKLNDHQSFVTSQTDSELHANHNMYLNGRVPNDTQLPKDKTLRELLKMGTNIVCQKEKNWDHNSVSFTDDFGSENAERDNTCDNSSNISLNTGATHTVNYNRPQCINHPGMHGRANESSHRYYTYNPQYNISGIRLPDILNFRQHREYFVKNTSKFQPLCNLYNCKQALCHDPQHTSSVCETVFTTNVTQVPAGLLGHDSVQGGNHQNLSNTMSNNMDMHAKHMPQPIIDLARQPVLVANYNTVTYVQNNIPCVV